jgi:hypothetical protein
MTARSLVVHLQLWRWVVSEVELLRRAQIVRCGVHIVSGFLVLPYGACCLILLIFFILRCESILRVRLPYHPVKDVVVLVTHAVEKVFKEFT